MKVYCRNCKYLGWDNVGRCYDGKTEMFLGMKTTQWSNKMGNCKYYKRKWWRF